MEIKLEAISIERICRCCLNTSEELMISLHDEDDLNKLNYYELINSTFGKIIPSIQNLPNRLCNECHEIVKKAYEFKKLCIKSTFQLQESSGDCDYLIEDANEKSTQTHDKFIQFDDENFDSINLHEEDVIFENPLSVLNPAITQSMTKCEDIAEEENSSEQFNEENEIIDNLSQSQIENDETYEIAEFSNEQINVDEEEVKVSDNVLKPKRNLHHHQCDKCNKKFSRATHLKRHLLTHEDLKTMQCTVCAKSFNRQDHLNQHMLNNHSETKPFQCDVPDCKKGFVKEDQLKKHTEAKHSDESSKDKVICSLCEKSFSSKKYLRSHMKVHNAEKSSGSKKDFHSERPFLCSECGLRFVRNDYLVIHMRRHLGVKPYKCRYCEKAFPRATDLTVHERYHTNEKTHLCNLCGKGFQRAYNLLVHMRVHTGEKPYSCSYCSKSFSQGNDLKAHIRRHTGERFKCEICSEGFIQGYHLTHHKRTAHGLDVKSHIRRVEKFVGTSSSAIALDKQDSIHESNIEQIKTENPEYQVVV